MHRVQTKGDFVIEAEATEKGKDIWMIFLPTRTDDYGILKINSMVQKIEN